jgi:hypothetical protein
MSKTPKPGSDDAATGKTSSGNTGIECAPKFDCQRPTVAVIAFILKKPPFIETEGDMVAKTVIEHDQHDDAMSCPCERSERSLPRSRIQPVPELFSDASNQQGLRPGITIPATKTSVIPACERRDQ